MKKEEELREALKHRLREIFRFDCEDLDFGIYRIMNIKRKEIERFIEEELIEKIEEQLNLIVKEEKERIKEELEKIKAEIVKNFGEGAFEGGELKEAFRDTPLAKEYYAKRKELEEIKVTEDLEKDVYNHLINFFSRYYDNGDFISKRRYGKKERYVIPYNGEEVLLYWANKGQYYVKTTEYFKKYSFKAGGLIVNFRIVEAEEEKGNVKAQEKKFFVLNQEIFDFNEKKGELNVYFEYRRLTEEEKETYGAPKNQEKVNEIVFEILKEKLSDKFGELFEIVDPEREDYKRYLLGRHLYRYTRRNTSDYFIHKDLKGFLERELDFYVKNEILALEDLQSLERGEYFDKLRLYLLRARVFRSIALKIIDFLAQIEEFQKKLWEKKKFVIETHYVITLDKIKEYAGEAFLKSILEEILSNKEQVREWNELFGIEVKGKEDLIERITLEGTKWKRLPVDTRHFGEDFKWRLLEAISKNLPPERGIDDLLDGILIKSENWQALNLLLNKYYERVQTIYIDPPFNKEQEADFLYKVGYKDATWITMLENRIRLAKELLNERGSIFVRCDYNGNMYVRMLLNEIFGKENFQAEIVLNRFKKRSNTFTTTTENLYFYSKNAEKLLFNPIFRPRICTFCKQPIKPRWHPMSSPGESKTPIVIDGKEFYPPKGRHWTYSQEKVDEMLKEGRIRINEKIVYTDVMGRKVRGMPEYLEATEQQVDNNWTDITGYDFGAEFSTQNSEQVLKRVIQASSNPGDLVMDFFLGSGTATAVAQKLGRKWIGVEMGEHFWTIVLPRMKRVLAYERGGISQDPDVKEKYNEESAGGFFKYHVLEQYEDSLENIEFEEAQKTLYDFQEYLLKYMLEWETRGSKTFLKVDELEDPFEYKLRIIENYRQKEVKVDLVETFNYLIGLHVKKYKLLEGGGRKYVFVFGEREGRRVAVVWRYTRGIDFERDREIVESALEEFDPEEIYVNGDSLVKGFRPIEPIFKSLMFEGVK